MEYKLTKPYTEKERCDFIVKCNHNMGLEIKETEDALIAIEHEITEEEQKQARIDEIQVRLDNLSQDFIQAYLGAKFEDFEARKAEFQSLHNELRELLGKKPRIYDENIEEN